MARRFLVGHDGSPASSRALAETAWRARLQHGCVTVVLAVPHAPRWAVFSPVSVITLEREARTEARRELARAVESLPARVSVTTVETDRPLGRALVELWQRGEHDAVVLAAEGPLGARSWAVRRLRRAGAEPIVVGTGRRRRRPSRRRSRAARRAKARAKIA